MRLIDADKLSEDAFEVQTQEYGNIEVVGLDAIDSMVTADAVEVVRCGECINRFNWHNGCGVCRIAGQNMNDTDFCSYGERKETT